MLCYDLPVQTRIIEDRLVKNFLAKTSISGPETSGPAHDAPWLAAEFPQPPGPTDGMLLIEIWNTP